ncbi:transposable element Tcb1 transposase [Trichonephila clavipes]|nr:transposable element Tcb1 transposase [Trichonephila clavipes]
MWYMVAQRLTQITPPAASLVQFWQGVEADFGLLYPNNTSKVSVNQCRGVWQRESCERHIHVQSYLFVKSTFVFPILNMSVFLKLWGTSPGIVR